MVGFVNDCNGQVNSFYGAENESTAIEIHGWAFLNATSWAQLLGVTGGALEMVKCLYHLLSWKFAANRAPVLASSQEDLRFLYLEDPHSTQTQSLAAVLFNTSHNS
jgi:hypothetical protein